MHEGKGEHPSPTDLEAYGLGLHAPPVAEVIERHVAACQACGEALGQVPDDGLVALLRSSTTTGGPRADTPAGPASEADTLPHGIPPELAGHPRYRILERLGAGGMGAVYKAEHRVLNQLVALKVIHAHLIHEPAAVERFQREIKAVAGLSHPNIVKARDAEEVAGLHYLVMDHVEGTTLARLVAEQGPQPAARACGWIRQAALGLQHAFERGIVHRDLKPHNLMAAPPSGHEPGGERLMILDFGLARFVRENDPALTLSGTAMGTPDYIAPEQALDARLADVRADIYSLGCTLYFLLTGQPPYPGGTSVEKVLGHLQKTPRPLRELRGDLPDELVRVVERMMARNPAQRYQTPAEVAVALERFVGPAVPGSRRRFPRRWWLVGIGAAAAVAITATALLIAHLSGDPDERGAKGKPPKEEQAPPQRPGGPEKPPGKEAPPKEAPPKEAPPKVAPPKVPPAKEVVAKAGLVRVYSGHKQWVKCVAFTPDGRSFVSGSFGELWLWDLDSKVERLRYPHVQGWVHSVAVSPDGERVLAGGQAGFVFLWELKTGKKATELEQLPGRQTVECVGFFPKRPQAFFCGKGGVRVHDLEKKQEVNARFPGGLASVSRDGRRLLSVEGRVLSLWDVETGNPLGHVEHRNEVLAAALAPDGRHAVAGGLDMTVQVWDMEEKKERQRLAGHTGTVQALAISPDGRRALSGGGDKMMRLWDLEQGKELHCFEGHTQPVVAVAFAPDGRQALSASTDKTIRLWQLPEPGPAPR